MKRKHTIDSLKVKSFVTDLTSATKDNLVVKGGTIDTVYGVNGCSIVRFPCLTPF
jgi:hypothetical protein